VLHVRLFGSFQALDDDAPVAALQSERIQAVLTYLLLNRYTPIVRQQLAFTFWPDTTDAQARHNLRTLLTRLREALPHADSFLTIEAQTIQWCSDTPFTLDVAEFEAALARGDVRAAIELYRGDVLPTCYDDWIVSERERLHALYVEALTQAINDAERQRDFVAALQYGQRALQADPLREETYRQLMRLHTANGDRVSLRRTYDTCTLILKRELDVEPSPTTRTLYATLSQLEVHPPVSEPLPPKARHNLKHPLTSFIGREREIGAVKHSLDSARLLTLSGAGGSGKTRLALQVAFDVLDNYIDGVWWVDLASIAQASLVTPTVATALSIHLVAGRTLVETLIDALQSRRLLLVLDNCEHLIAECAALAHDLLAACPPLTILATSSEALGLNGERVWPVPPLQLATTNALSDIEESEAVQLFIARAALTLPTFTISPQTATAITAVCQQLDGLPLAIELAAARVKVLSVEQIAARLDDRFTLLTHGDRAALPRHQTLRAMIDWSYDLLDEAERALLRTLAVFAGSFTLEAAEAVHSAAPVLDLLARLVDKSLVVVGTEHAGDNVRYSLLETIRQYAREKLNDSGEGEAVRERRTRWYVELAERAEPKLRGHGQIEWLDRMEQEHDNVRAALEWSLNNNIDLGLRIANGLIWFWDTRDHALEGLQQMGKLLAAGPLDPSRLHARALARASWMAMAAFNEERMAALAAAGATMSREVGDVEGLAFSLIIAAIVPHWHGDNDRALLLAEESLALFEAAGIQGKHRVLSAVGLITQAQGNYERAHTAYQASLALCRESGDINFGNFLLLLLGNLTFKQGHYEQAMTYYVESLASARAVKNTNMIAWNYEGMGNLDILLGQYGPAQALLEESKGLLQEVGDHWRLAFTLRRLGRVARLQGRYDQAARFYTESLHLARKSDWHQTLAWCLASLAELAALRDQLQKAARLWGAANGIPELYIDFGLTERLELEQMSGTIRAQLDEATFTAEQTAGRQMTLAEAIVYALEDVNQQ
jgi:predicted ATPase/DNA-binding SARP family transcriptional activator